MTTSNFAVVISVLDGFSHLYKLESFDFEEEEKNGWWPQFLLSSSPCQTVIILYIFFWCIFVPGFTSSKLCEFIEPRTCLKRDKTDFGRSMKFRCWCLLLQNSHDELKRWRKKRMLELNSLKEGNPDVMLQTRYLENQFCCFKSD